MNTLDLKKSFLGPYLPIFLSSKGNLVALPIQYTFFFMKDVTEHVLNSISKQTSVLFLEHKSSISEAD